MQKQVSLAELASVDIQKFGKEELMDASQLCLDPKVPQASRADWLLNAVGNPYCFRVGELGVKLEFVDKGPSLQDVFLDFLQRKKSGFSSCLHEDHS